MKTFKIIVYPGEDGYFVVEALDLPGCISQGRTKEEALKNIKEAIELYLDSPQHENGPIRMVEVQEVAVEI
ncbi:MAG: type II toxin-antitoxin system HicB family antitoxin [Nanoarchaeota archaeon]